MRNLLYSSVGSVDYSVSGNEAKGMCGTDFLIAQLASQKKPLKADSELHAFGFWIHHCEKKKKPVFTL